jgi:RNA polymerase primary sigma factor
MTLDLERAPTPEEIAKKLEIPTAEVISLLQVADENVSLSTVIDEEHEFHLSDKLEQDLIPSADAALMRSSLKDHLYACLGELDPKEQKVLRLRFGLDEGDPKTLKEIGEMMGLSRERIRQIEAQALEKLHRSQKCQQLQGYLN